jgi:hypothetical protein
LIYGKNDISLLTYTPCTMEAGRGVKEGPSGILNGVFSIALFFAYNLLASLEKIVSIIFTCVIIVCLFQYPPLIYCNEEKIRRIEPCESVSIAIYWASKKGFKIYLKVADNIVV